MSDDLSATEKNLLDWENGNRCTLDDSFRYFQAYAKEYPQPGMQDIGAEGTRLMNLMFRFKAEPGSPIDSLCQGIAVGAAAQVIEGVAILTGLRAEVLHLMITDPFELLPPRSLTEFIATYEEYKGWFATHEQAGALTLTENK